MNVTHLLSLAEHAVSSRPGKPATAIAHDSPDGRSVVFRIAPGEEVPVHQSASTVTLCVLDGMGSVSGAEGERIVSRGDLVAYAPHEPHGMRALGSTLVILASISPRPGARQASPSLAMASSAGA